MRKLTAGLLAFCFLIVSASAQVFVAPGTFPYAAPGTSAPGAVPMQGVASGVPVPVSPAPGQLFPTNSVQSCGPSTGTLNSASGAGSSVTLTCAGAANYLIQITPGSPNLNATISFNDSVTGGSRRIFKTGVGPLEVATEKLDGTQGQLEYRTSGGGDGLTVSLPSYTSGSATVRIVASYNPVMTFINGPVHTTFEAALRAGRAFLASSGAQTLGASQYLNMTLTNPAGSGRNLFVYLRQFSQNGGTVLTYRTWANPTPITTNPVTPANNRSDSTMTSVATVGWNAGGTTTFTTGTQVASGYLPVNGADEQILVPIMLAPGQTRGYAIQAPAGLGASAGVVVDLVWFEEGIN